MTTLPADLNAEQTRAASESTRRAALLTAAERDAIDAAVVDLKWARSVLAGVIRDHSAVIGNVPGIGAFAGLDQHTDPDGLIIAELTKRTGLDCVDRLLQSIRDGADDASSGADVALVSLTENI
jgi:hypothetical protein